MTEYRPATSIDNLDIARISVEGWKHAYKGIFPDEVLSSLDYKERAKGRANFLEHAALSTYVCVEDGRTVGFVDFELCRDDDCDAQVGEIWAIYVLPDFMGRGIGKRLLQEAEKKLSERGCRAVTVWVLYRNAPARGFYEKQGFLLDGKEKDYQGLREVRYRKSLMSGACAKK